MDIGALIAPLFSALCAFAGSWLAFSTRLTRVETKLESIEIKQDKHNEVIERTYRLENDMSTAWKRHDELVGRINRIEEGRRYELG